MLKREIEETPEEFEKAFALAEKEVEELFGKGRISSKTTDQKLTEYKCFIHTSIGWKSRQHIIKMVRNFLLKEIDAKTFSDQFFAWHYGTMREADELCEKIEEGLKPLVCNFEYLPKSEDFNSMTNNMFFEIDQYDPNLEDSDWNEFVYSESKLRHVIQTKYLPTLLKSCDLDSTFLQPKLSLDQLIERSYYIFFSSAIVAIGFSFFNLI